MTRTWSSRERRRYPASVSHRAISIAALALVAAAMLVAALARPAEAALVPYDLASLTSKSQYIVAGRVAEVQSYWGMLGKLGPVMLTDVTIDVDEAWKGKPPEVDGKPRLTIQLLGGRIGDRWQRCAESPEYTVGERVLVFARPFNDAIWTTGWLQGKYRIEESTGSDGKTAMTLRGKTGAPLATGSGVDAVKALVAERLRDISRAEESPIDAEGSR